MPPPKKKKPNAKDSNKSDSATTNSKREDRGMRNEYAKILRHADTAGAELRDARIGENLSKVDGVFKKLSSKSDGSASVMAMDASVIRLVDGMNRFKCVELSQSSRFICPC